MEIPVDETPSRHLPVLKRMSKLGKKANNFATGVKEHVRLAPKITETVKGKLSLGAKIIQVGGPIAGLLFISTNKVAFCSERSLKFYSSSGELIRVHYKAHRLSAHGLSAHGLSAHGLPAHEFSAYGSSAHGLSAHGLPANEFSAHGSSAHGLSAHGFSAHRTFAHRKSAHGAN
ncbi:GEM-like protein 4 [Citrus sinensis]|nr:GEM-like protein 4 [Citrus sinensis]